MVKMKISPLKKKIYKFEKLEFSLYKKTLVKIPLFLIAFTITVISAHTKRKKNGN